LLCQLEELMSNQDFPRASAGNKGQAAQTAKETLSTASSFAEETVGKVKQAASETVASLSGEMKDMLNRQVGGSADKLTQVARSVRRAADDLERESPQIAGLARTVAARVDGYATQLRDQSVDELWQSATDFTRRQPALVFGLAALTGFFLFRTIKSRPTVPSPSLQPSHSYTSSREERGYYGP
jgi:ABC-type transporter Mla subunit MlaD